MQRQFADLREQRSSDTISAERRTNIQRIERLNAERRTARGGRLAEIDREVRTLNERCESLTFGIERRHVRTEFA